MDCGTHGSLDEDCECACSEGWTTEPFQNATDVLYCNMSTSEGKQQISNSKTYVLDHHHIVLCTLAWLIAAFM